MPFVRSSGAKSEIDQKLKTKRQQIIEEERIRVLGDSLILFYDKLMEKYVLIHPQDDEVEGDVQSVVREEVEQLARDHAATKPIGY
ncbi:MAG TPA: hypothetical protein EYM76_02640 [Candidatus Marinimicrobia bacterium]|nr:hypothetical protein [Candidatus Neomarinimicrobiota bacterium]